MLLRAKRRFVPPRIERQVAAARRHARFDQSLVERAMKQSPHLVRVQATPEARRLYNLSNQVSSEVNRLTCYLRLKINPHGLLYAKHTPDHRIEDLLVSHFLYRFPLYVILLGSKRGTFVGERQAIYRSSEPLAQLIEQLEKERPLDPILQELKATDDEVWEAFYQSQVVKEKHSQSRFLKNVPKRFLGMDSFEVERKSFRGTKGLEAFMK